MNLAYQKRPKQVCIIQKLPCCYLLVLLKDFCAFFTTYKRLNFELKIR
jgi:hypothetical protein